MRVAMVHYHLRRGGVTRVIHNAVTALKDHEVTTAVLCGETPDESLRPSCPIEVVDGLGYDETGPVANPTDLLQRMRDAARRALDGTPDIWHIHNHAVGKNRALPQVVSALARDGEKLLVHLHDFAEDGRPSNYQLLSGVESSMYPCGDSVHYALLNGRDHRFMCAAGLASGHAHLLPNAVWTGDVTTPSARDVAPDGARPLWLYPTRAIRRKNIGEFLLWAAAAESDALFGVTLAPESAGEIKRYERWKAFTKEQKLPVSFEMGLRHDFHALLARAHRLVTTSVAEGFGLAFLEPWLARRALCGRRLPEVTAEFEAGGVDLSALYDEVTVPRAWIDQALLADNLQKAMDATMCAYGRQMKKNDVERAMVSAVIGDRVAFAKLDEPLQEVVIQRVTQEGASALGPARLDAVEIPDEVIESNCKIVREHYSLEQYGRRVMKLYEEVARSRGATRDALPPGALLDQFLIPERFCLIRS